ncbi:hypothetical protein JXA88_10825 [Candidatus Fermentibacteria bacterium]|nr:hypothetical protein [Candidatus Fermentibacteria bacterium]
MLGTLIRRLRLERGISLGALADDAGVAPEMLEALEAERVELIDDSEEFLRIIDRLEVRQAFTFGQLLDANQPRRFRAYNVGLMKSGTSSIAGIFGDYRTRHEFMLLKTSNEYGRYCHGTISRDEFREFLRHRDVSGALEMDSTSWSFEYVDFLVDEYPDALFIFTFRDCYSWLNSVIDFILWSERIEFTGRLRGRLGIPFDLARGDAASRDKLVPTMASLAEGFLRLWREANEKVLQAVPPERLLIVRTHEISKSLGRMAEFIGVPADTLIQRRSHLFKTPVKRRILHTMEFDRLNAFCDQHCGPLMRRHFPELNLKEYLAQTSSAKP